MEFLCCVTPQGLLPMYDSDYEEKKRLHEGDIVLCTINRQRNYKFHKKFFALLRLTFENLPEYMVEEYNIHSIDDLLTRIKLELNLFDTIEVKGEKIVKLHSISFSEMDNTRFEKFYDLTIDLIRFKFLRLLDKQTILEEVENFM